MAQTVDLARRLVLGTVQFGMPYGVTNVSGQVTENEAAAIVALAVGSGIDCVDTAAGYGTSEAVLGAILPDFPSLRVITKLPSLGSTTISEADIHASRQNLLQSLGRLRRDHLDAVLLHNTADVLKPGGQRVIELLQSLKQDGIARRIGVSVYDADDIDGALDLFMPDIVQLPLNLFDQRLIESGHIGRLARAGVEIHARSAFLQGVLLVGPALLPGYFRFFDESFGRYDMFLAQNSVSRMQACLGFMMEQSGAHRIVVGVASADELRGILASAERRITLPPMRELASHDLSLVDPRRWALSPVTKVSAQ